MGQQQLITAMEEEVEAQIAASDRQAEEAIGRIEAEAATAEAEALGAEQARADQQLRAYQRQQRLRFENHWRSREQDVQLEVAQRVFEAVEQAVAVARQREDYPHVFARLLAESLQAYAGERSDRPILRVAPADLQRAQAHQSSPAAIEASNSIREGVELSSPDGRVHVKNTLTSRLCKGRDDFIKIISDAFKQQNPP